jgi:prophage regulatory protein
MLTCAGYTALLNCAVGDESELRVKENQRRIVRVLKIQRQKNLYVPTPRLYRLYIVAYSGAILDFRSTGLSRSTIYLRIAQGTFPKTVRLGGRAAGWLEVEVEQRLQRRIEASPQ